jgi:hypothetical protein
MLSGVVAYRYRSHSQWASAERGANGINGSLHNTSAAELADDAESSWASGSIIVGGSGSSGDLAGALSHRHVSSGA